MKIKQSRIKEIFHKLNDKRIAVIGDVMLDEYLTGSVSRVSPEAPVPVVDIKEHSIRFGGAANVCLNLASLGATPIPFGIIGEDDFGKVFLKMAEKEFFSSEGILSSSSRPTTVKTRVIGSNQHIVRIDKEVKSPLSTEETSTLIQTFKQVVSTLDAVIFEDYNKGVITKELINALIPICIDKNVPIFVDPKFSNFFEYKNVTLFKPNSIETSTALSKDLETIEDYKQAALDLHKKLQSQHILITLNADGMLLLEDGKHFHHIPTMAVEVADVSGAGDTVISTLIAMYVSGASIKESVVLANNAAGVVVTEVGIIPITQTQLIQTGTK